MQKARGYDLADGDEPILSVPGGIPGQNCYKLLHAIKRNIGLEYAGQ